MIRASFTTLIGMLCAAAMAEPETVVGGPGNDYQASVLIPWSQPQHRLVVFERLSAPGFIGDLWQTSSSDAGSTWQEPVPVIATSANERHASLVQTGASTVQLFHLSNASGAFRIHRASSTGQAPFVAHGALDLGWASGGEINPQVMREANGDLLLVYQRLSGAAYISRSSDNGLTWDGLRTQISPANAALPRLTWRDSDARYLLAYQTGSNPVTIWIRTSHESHAWTDTPVALSADGNNHDPWPMVMPDGRFVVLWARVDNGAFQIHSSHSRAGLQWSPPLAHSARPGLHNVQPLALAPAAGRAELWWGASQVPGDTNYDIVRLIDALLVDPIFADGHEP